VANGKRGASRGESASWAVLTDAIISEGRQRRHYGERTVALAREFGVKPSTLDKALAGKTWKHLPNPAPIRGESLAAGLKFCAHCRQPRPVAEFGDCGRAKDGLQSWCRPCYAKYARDRRAGLPKEPDRRLVFRGATWNPPGSATALAYLAGIIDGEGSVGYQYRGRETRHYRVAVIMTSEETIRWIGQWGGTVAALPPRPGKPHWKPQWIWRVTGYSNVRAVLTAVLPYLITKKATAIDALAYIAARPGANPPYAALIA
jgi:hypothetical protein